MATPQPLSGKISTHLFVEMLSNFAIVATFAMDQTSAVVNARRMAVKPKTRVS
jgi:hypothetical protein